MEIEREINAVPFTVYGFDSTMSRQHNNECGNKIFKLGSNWQGRSGPRNLDINFTWPNGTHLDGRDEDDDTS